MPKGPTGLDKTTRAKEVREFSKLNQTIMENLKLTSGQSIESLALRGELETTQAVTLDRVEILDLVPSAPRLAEPGVDENGKPIPKDKLFVVAKLDLPLVGPNGEVAIKRTMVTIWENRALGTYEAMLKKKAGDPEYKDLDIKFLAPIATLREYTENGVKYEAIEPVPFYALRGTTLSGEGVLKTWAAQNFSAAKEHLESNGFEPVMLNKGKAMLMDSIALPEAAMRIDASESLARAIRFGFTLENSEFLNSEESLEAEKRNAALFGFDTE